MAGSRRSLLAALWSIVGLLTLTSFVIAIVFACASENYYDASSNGNGNNNNGGGGSGDDREQQQQQNGGGGNAISVTSRAMVFAAIWTAVLSGILVVYGTVILGIRVPVTGEYYACCRGNVHRMTPMSLGAFGGSLLMFANLTLVFAILFGEFEVRPDDEVGEWKGGGMLPSSLPGMRPIEYFTSYCSSSACEFDSKYLVLATMRRRFAISTSWWAGDRGGEGGATTTSRATAAPAASFTNRRSRSRSCAYSSRSCTRRSLA